MAKKDDNKNDDLNQRLDQLSKFLNEFPDMQIKQEEELLKRSKSLSELIISETFIVTDVVSRHYATNIESSQWQAGSIPQYTNTGYISKTILTVRPLSEVKPGETYDSPVRELVFNGHSSARAGDIIRATIPAYTEAYLQYQKEGDSIKRRSNPEMIYIDRKLEEKESPIVITILPGSSKDIEQILSGNSQNLNPLRTEQSADYGKYYRK
jgi:hypothetical protein